MSVYSMNSLHVRDCILFISNLQGQYTVYHRCLLNAFYICLKQSIYKWWDLQLDEINWSFFSTLEKEQRELYVQKSCEGLRNVLESKCFFFRKQFLWSRRCWRVLSGWEMKNWTKIKTRHLRICHRTNKTEGNNSGSWELLSKHFFSGWGRALSIS